MNRFLSSFLLLLLVLSLTPFAARATGPTVYAGDSLSWSCVAPTAFTDGNPIPTGTAITYKIYVTQTVPMIGTHIATSNGCLNISAPATGLAQGQWHSYASASILGHGESAVGTDVPFVLAPDLLPPMPPTAPTGLTLTITPKAVAVAP